MLGTKIKFEGVKGVGTVELDLQEDQRVYTLIGTNGVGKTKALEALFQVLFFTNLEVIKIRPTRHLLKKNWVFESCTDLTHAFHLVSLGTDTEVYASLDTTCVDDCLIYDDTKIYQHNIPIIFLASQNRGFIEHKATYISFGSFDKRKLDYLERTIEGINNGFSSLNMDIDIEQWFVTLAQSSNKFQKGSDNREIEISTVLKLLNMLDDRINPEYLEIDGDGRVSLKIEGQPCELSHLSTGFASIVKIIQAIVSGYGAFTNENNLAHVKGIVLIDEIESHLHLTWQAKIIPLLKQLFPNTTFYITTHSSIVLSQLQEGEAYRLNRSDDGVVRTNRIERPNKASIIDVLKDAFDVDVNKIKRENMFADDQKAAKQKLLDLLNQGDG